MAKPSDLLSDDPRRIPVDPERLQQLDYAQRIAGKPKKGIYNAELKGPEPLWKQIIGGLMSDPGLSPVGLGVVAGSPGGNALAEQLASEAGESGLDPFDAVKRYMQLKYPRLMRNITGGITAVNSPSGIYGQYFDQGTHELGIDPEFIKQQLGVSELPPQWRPAPPRSIEINLNKAYTPQRITQSMGHELTHGIQDIRTPGVFEQQRDIPYWDRPYEHQAQQGGATALKTMLKFIDQYPELKEFFRMH